MIGQIYKLPLHLPILEKIHLAEVNFRKMYNMSPDLILVPGDWDIEGLKLSTPVRVSPRAFNDCLWAVKEIGLSADSIYSNKGIEAQ